MLYSIKMRLVSDMSSAKNRWEITILGCGFARFGVTTNIVAREFAEELIQRLNHKNVRSIPPMKYLKELVVEKRLLPILHILPQLVVGWHVRGLCFSRRVEVKSFRRESDISASRYHVTIPMK